MNENLRDKQMNLTLLMYSLLAVAVLSVALYLTITSNTEIIFQTPCAIQFLPDQPTPTLNATYTFVPQVGRTYKAKDLATEMTRGARGIFPQFLVEFKDRFVITCGIPLRITDREYAPGEESVTNGIYVGPRYGEAQRFLNHMLIQCEISYPQYDIDSGQVFTSLYSTKSLMNARIGFDPIPAPPSSATLVVNAANPNLLIVTWVAPPSPFYSVGIYLADSGAIDTQLINWDIVSTPPTFYTFTDLSVGDSYGAAVTFVGRYDESTLTIARNTNVILPGILTLNTFNLLAGTTTSPNNTNTLGQAVVDAQPNTTVRRNRYTRVVNNSAVRWPSDLISFQQIKSFTIRFYASIDTTLPSDSRLSFGINGPLIYYMYWRIVAKDATDTSQFPYAFASTNASVGTTGAIQPPLAYTSLTITNPVVLANLFSTLGVGPDDIYLFFGYASTSMLYNFSSGGVSAPAIVSALSLTYTS